MKKLLYFTARDMTLPGEGINKKIMEQIATFRRFGFQVEAVYRKNDSQLYCHNGQSERRIANNMKRPYKVAASKYLRKYVRDKHYDGAFIRYVYGDWQFQRLLKVLKEKKIPVVIEIPSYPYDIELVDTFENRIVLLLDKIYRKKLKYYVDRIMTFSNDKKIFGVPTIQTMNGVNFDKIRMISPNEMYSNKINIIAVANLAIWHGFDRLLEGLGEYYHNKGKRDILFHLVGDGKELQSYHAIVDKWGGSCRIT